MLRAAFKSVMLAGIYAPSLATARSDFVDALSPLPGVSFKLTKGHRSSTADKVTNNFQHVHALRGDGTNTKSVASILGAHQRQVGGTGYQNITSTTAYGTQYAIELAFADVPLQVLLDTGSSDTWIVQEGFECVDFAGEDVDTATCGFGPAYPGDFQYGAIPEQHIYIQYGDGEIVYGPVGYSDITLGNITVKRQEAGLANTTYWYGNNVTSGVLGLAYPSLTNAYLGSGYEHNWLDEVSYSPIFTSMVNQGLVLPYFSMAINRNSSGGLIAWGGIPPVKGLDYSTAVSMDIIVTNLIDNPYTAWQYSFYTIVPDGWQWDSTTNMQKFCYIVDSGTTLNYLPPDIAEAINSAFQPAAVYLWMYGAFFTSCNARAPILAVVMKGVRFYINPVDLIFHDLVDPLTGLCMTGIASGGTGPYILGDVFLQNALAVFDVGHSQMRFISRQFY